MWPSRSHILYSLTEVSSVPKVRALIWNNGLEVTFCEMNITVSAETLINYPNWKIPFIVHIDDYNKQLGVVIGQQKTYWFLFETIKQTTIELHYNKEGAYIDRGASKAVIWNHLWMRNIKIFVPQDLVLRKSSEWSSNSYELVTHTQRFWA